MNANGNGLKVVHSNGGRGANRFPSSLLQIVAAAVGLAVLFVGGARFLPQLDADRANDVSAQPRAEVQAELATFDYFPAQYENQAKEKEEHIQAF